MNLIQKLVQYNFQQRKKHKPNQKKTNLNIEHSDSMIVLFN